MAQYNTSCSSVPDASSEVTVRQKVCAASVRARIAALEGNLPGAADTTSTPTAEPDFEKRFTPSPRAQSCKPADTQRDADSSGSSLPSPFLKNVARTSAVKANTDVSNKTRVSLASAVAAWIHYSGQESTTILKPETQESSVPSFPKVHQSTKLSLAQQNSAKPPKLPERQNYIRTCGTLNKGPWESMDPSVPKRSLPGVLALGNAPPKPSRPPSVDIHRFRRNRKSLSDGPGMKIPQPVAPPPLRSWTSSNHAAAVSQQMDEDESYDDVGIMIPPPLPSEGHPSKRTEEPKGTINSEEMKGQDIKAKKQKRKQQKAKEKRDQEAKKKFKIKGPVHVIKRKTAFVDFKGGKSNSSPNQGEITEVVHSTDDRVKTESVEAESDVYDDIGAPAEICSGLTVRNLGEDGVYVNVDDPDTRDSPLPQPTADGDNVYYDAVSQSPPLPSDGLYL